MGLRLAYSNSGLRGCKPDTTPSAPPLERALTPSESSWLDKRRMLHAKNPHLAKMIEDMTDNFLENGVSADDAFHHK